MSHGLLGVDAPRKGLAGWGQCPVTLSGLLSAVAHPGVRPYLCPPSLAAYTGFQLWGGKRPLPPQPVCLSKLSQSRSVGQSHGLDPGRGRRAVTCEGGTEPSPSDAVRIAPGGLLAATSGKRRSAQGCPAHLMTEDFKPDFC